MNAIKYINIFKGKIMTRIKIQYSEALNAES